MFEKLKWQHKFVLGPAIGIAGLIIAVETTAATTIFLGGIMFIAGCVIMVLSLPENVDAISCCE